VEERSALRAQLEHSLNAPRTSSMGRLFDSVAALAGVRQKINYEAQAAIELEMQVDPHETGAYRFDFQGGSPLVIDPAPLYGEVVADVLAARPVAVIAARFHNGVAQMVLEVCRHVRQAGGPEIVALSGGVWQNVTLLKKTVPLLERDGFTVWVHQAVPANDGGLALGQVVIASHRLKVDKLKG
jgi:hydrogenase maturation protein HypF